MMFLVDTNIFIEILLQQEKSDICKKFLSDNEDNILISDFSLHSIGVILFRTKKQDLFDIFLDDIFEKQRILTLKHDDYQKLCEISKYHGTDFDDSYQYLIAKTNDLKIATMDNDFKRFKDIDVIFI